MALCLLCAVSNSQIYTAKPGETLISFHSEEPIENIDALCTTANIILSAASNDLQIGMTMTNFKFKNSLMEEHFNENYLESSKYPRCIFKGKINEQVDYTKNGETKVTVSGKLYLHGVTKDVLVSGAINISNGELQLQAKFPIRVADYNIQVPSMYIKNIAEVVDVTFKSHLEPFKKK